MQHKIKLACWFVSLYLHTHAVIIRNRFIKMNFTLLISAHAYVYIHVTINEARDVFFFLCFLSPPTQHSLSAGHSYYANSGQVRVVIAMMTGRKEMEQDVLAALFEAEEGRSSGGGVMRGWGWMWFLEILRFSG